MEYTEDYYQVLGAVLHLAEKNGVYGKHHTQEGFYSLCEQLWDKKKHWSAGRFRALSFVNRFLACKARPYNVAEHTCNVAILCMICLDIIDTENVNVPAEFRAFVYERALLHDCTETLSMDVPYFVKEKYNKVIDRFVSDNLYSLNLSKRLSCISSMDESICVENSEENFVVFFVRIVDTIELALFCLEEKLLGRIVVDNKKVVLHTCLNMLSTTYTERLRRLSNGNGDYYLIAYSMLNMVQSFTDFVHEVDNEE
jgi:5'-deoxynucleotidase YfbR-like HD superfamily hydrolase